MKKLYSHFDVEANGLILRYNYNGKLEYILQRTEDFGTYILCQDNRLIFVDGEGHATEIK